MSDQLSTEWYFPAPVYFIEKPEFLQSVSAVSEERLIEARKSHDLDDIYPVYMTGNYYEDERIEDFVSYVGSTVWNILNEQGYHMDNFLVHFSEMWTQEHYKHSAMEQHVHPGSVMVGFYFLETPDNSSKVVFHDPRAGKIMVDLPQKDQSMATMSSQMINFTPRPGLLMFAPGWMAHSFTRHMAMSPIKFVHFNLYAKYNEPVCICPAEVI